MVNDIRKHMLLVETIQDEEKYKSIQEIKRDLDNGIVVFKPWREFPKFGGDDPGEIEDFMVVSWDEDDVLVVDPDGEAMIVSRPDRLEESIGEEDFYDEDDDLEPIDDDEMDVQAEMETGIVISDAGWNRQYNVAAEGRQIADNVEMSEALAIVRDWMNRNSYWPNVFVVNDHGNVTQVTLDGKEIRSWV